MKIEYFGYFCEVVESQGISLAAQKMYISQQGLSKALNVIESELGTTLLNRNRNSGSVSLTAEGQIFYDYASSIWKEYSRMCTVFQSLKGKQSGGEKVTICGTKFLLNNVLTPVFHTMTATGKELPQILEKSIDEIFSGLDSQPSNQLNILLCQLLAVAKLYDLIGVSVDITRVIDHWSFHLSFLIIPTRKTHIRDFPKTYPLFQKYIHLYWHRSTGSQCS